MRNTLQFSTIPLGILAGGFLADYVFEPFMMTENPVSGLLQMIVGKGAAWRLCSCVPACWERYSASFSTGKRIFVSWNFEEYAEEQKGAENPPLMS